VHRFGDSVALFVGTGETVYLTARDARRFTRAINEVIRSFDKGQSFVESTCRTYSASVPDGREVARKARLELRKA